jgi:predicted SAM-dependent methyltransferase
MRKILLFLLSHRCLAILRCDAHFIAVRLRNWIIGQNGRISTFLAGRTHPVLLNLGSGPRGRSDAHWVNVDGYRDRNVHFSIDLRRRLPFRDNSFDGVFSEHVLEHFTQEEGFALLREVLRVLRPCGVFRIVVPDGEFVLRTYLEAPHELVSYRGEGDETAMEMVNSFFRQRYEHQFMFDRETLKRLLSKAGFRDVTPSAFGRTESQLALAIDDEKYARESLYIEARKP